jgi:hypothetical protein
MIKKEQVFVNERHWRGMTENQLEDFAQLVFDYYRQEGFPYYPTDEESRVKDFNKLMAYDRSSLIGDDIVKQTMHGLGLAWSYLPNSFDVRCGNKMTPYEAFMDDEIFMGVIKKRLIMGTYISDSGIRKMLKIFTGVQAVSNFRPTAAAALYDMFAKNGVVWDMSAGWGGRLLGAIVSGVDTYIGTEPSTETVLGLNALANNFGWDINTSIVPSGSEEYRPYKSSLDFCFTSPPYFDLEKYSDEETQSYKKFPERELWIEGFLRPTFRNCYYGLKPDGIMAINLADIRGHELEADMVRVAEEVGFRMVKKLKLALSNVNLRDKAKKFKYEPIYLFTK